MILVLAATLSCLTAALSVMNLILITRRQRSQRDLSRYLSQTQLPPPIQTHLARRYR